MQNSNLSSKIFPNLREEWIFFIGKVSHDLQEMITTYNNDKRRIRDLEHIINKLKEIKDLSKDNIEEVLNYRELFMYIDNSLESSFDALNFFKRQNNLDNPASKSVYERIVNSPNMLKINSEYNSLTIKVSFDKERIKRLGELIRGSKVDYTLIRELVNKYKLNDEQKKNILFYPVVMLSIKQNDLKSSKENKEKQKQEKIEFYNSRFKELTELFQTKKENYKNLLIKCFNVREGMNHQEIDTYNGFANNPKEIDQYDFDDEIKFKIYTLSFFKVKKDIESFIDSISDLLTDNNDLDDELAFFEEMISEFDSVAIMLNSLIKVDDKVTNEVENNVFFALNAFNRLIIKEELLLDKNRSGIKAILQKANNINNSKIDGVRTNHMLGVEESERLLGKNISILITNKIMLAYVVIGKNVLIISGDTTNTAHFDRMINHIIDKNIVSLKKQINLIENEDFDYIDLQNKIVKTIIEEELETNQKTM